VDRRVTRFGKALTLVTAAIGLPAAGLGVWWRVASTHHPMLAAGITLTWEAAVGLGWLVARIAAKPIGQRLEQLGDALDGTLGRKVTRYGKRYQRYVLSWLRFVDSKGLATVGDITPEFDEVFVDVGLAARAPLQVGSGLLADVPAEITDRRSILQFLHHDKPGVLAVLGAPGSGKTTLLRHVARDAAANPNARRRSVPILLELRDHATRIGDDQRIPLSQLIRTLIPDLGVAEPPGWWEEQLRRGACLVLLDGLDEVARDEDRRVVADWIERQIAAYPNNDFVVTSRPHGYRAAVISSALVLQARPFTAEQVERFLRGWYRAIEQKATGTEGDDVRLRAESQAADLLERLADIPALSELTANPLLLTMIANVHRYRGALPGSRADLYGEVCQVMLWRRAEARRQPLALSGLIKERVLAQLAYEMMSRRVRDLPRVQVLDLIRPALRRASRTVTPEAFLADVGSNGLLVERERDLYAFAHLTFQEYLASSHIREKSLVAVLAKNVNDTWWRETTLLYTAKADADLIVRACLDARTVTALALAFDCTEGEGDLSPNLHDELEATLDAAFAPDARPAYRRLVAGVLATRHFSRLEPVGAGVGICPNPVPANLYQLFLLDTSTRRPDGHFPEDCRTTDAVTGIWATEAHKFVMWINALTDGVSDAYRLPTFGEIDKLVASRPSPRHVSFAHVWARPTPGLWAPALWSTAGRRSPQRLARPEMFAAVASDVAHAPLLGYLQLVRTHSRARLIHYALDRDSPEFRSAYRHYLISARILCNEFQEANQIGIIAPVATVLELDYASLLSNTSAMLLELGFTLGPPNAALQTRSLRRVQEAAGALHRVLDQAFAALYSGRNRHLAAHEPHELNIASDMRSLAHAFAFDRDIKADPDVIFTLGPGSHDGLANSGIMGVAFDRAMTAALERRDENPPQSPAERFAESLLRDAGIPADAEFEPPLERLEVIAQRTCAALIDASRPGTWQVATADRLAASGEKIFSRETHIDSASATEMRLAALALAEAADRTCGANVGDGFRTLAAGITLLERRTENPESLESLILVRP
jgi:NACHT domain